MKIVDAIWTKKANWYSLVCTCGNPFKVRADRWLVECPKCGLQDYLGRLREQFRLAQALEDRRLAQ